MKYLIFTLLCVASGGAWADCSNTPAYEAAECYSKEVSLLKKQLNQTYKLLHSQTSAKSELEAAQKSWINYRDKQCGDFTLADAGPSSGQAIYDLSCQADLLKSRINYLKSITRY